MELLLLQATGQATGGGWSMLLMIAAIVVVFYFFMIRPQQKKQKEVEKARASLTKGDRVVTSGGIYGKISKVQDDFFEIEVDNDVHLRLDKASVFKAAEKK